jgi:hypothetical protein
LIIVIFLSVSEVWLNENLHLYFVYRGDGTLLRSPEGMAVKNVCINRDLLLWCFERLPVTDWSETSIHSLLNPADAQDVGAGQTAWFNC